MNKIKVLIVDDSALVRQVMLEMLGSDPDIEVVGTAADPYIARDKIKKFNPDVLTLDIEMPRMDGITFLTNLMRLRPMPVVMVSSLTEDGAEVTLDALHIGAVDFVTKPKADSSQELVKYKEKLIEKVKSASQAKVRTYHQKKITVEKKYNADTILKKTKILSNSPSKQNIIAIGASTGGTEAISRILRSLPASVPAIVITQHIPAAFSKPFAKRLNKYSEITVCEASDRQVILPGNAYIAPGDQHLLVKRQGKNYICCLKDGNPVNRHRPSVDVLFRSVALNVGQHAIGIILTGMGADGAQGLLEIKQSGGNTIAQDQNSSIIWGMPGEAVKLDAANHILSLDNITEYISRLPANSHKNLELS